MISWNAIDAVLLSLLQYYNFKTISFRWKLEKSVLPQQICFFSSYFVFKRSFVDSHQTDELLIEKKMWNTKTTWKTRLKSLSIQKREIRLNLLNLFLYIKKYSSFKLDDSSVTLLETNWIYFLSTSLPRTFGPRSLLIGCIDLFTNFWTFLGFLV